MISCSGRRGRKESWAVDRMWAKASRTVEFRCMVTDGRPEIKKILFIPLWFRSGNIRCKWEPDHRMDGFGNKKANVLKFSFPGGTFSLFWKWVWLLALPVCVQHVSFEEMLQRLQRSTRQTIICRTWRSVIVYTWPPLTKPREKLRGKKRTNLHKRTQRSAVSAHGSSPSILIAAPGSCCQAFEMNSHGAAVVMSQMRSALTWAWTHQREWSCSLSCRRQTIVAADSSTSSLGSEQKWLPFTSTLIQTLNRRTCTWAKSRMLARVGYSKLLRLGVCFSADLSQLFLVLYFNVFLSNAPAVTTTCTSSG